MRASRLLAAWAAAVCAVSASATTYVITPTDRELVVQSAAIVRGAVEGSFVQVAKEGGFETVYEIRVRHGFKGNLAEDALVRVASPGGELGRFGSYAPGTAHFVHGEDVLLFLSRSNGRWTVTHDALGAFRQAQTLKGERLLVRDTAEVQSFDRAGSGEAHRSEARFLRFVEQTVAGVSATEDYLVAAEISSPTRSSGLSTTTDSAADPKRFTQMSGSTFGVRWNPTTIASPGLAFHKYSLSNLTGAADGGVGAIQTGLAAWTNEAGSDVTLGYGGTTDNLPGNTSGSANPAFTGFADGVNTIQFNAAIASAGRARIIFYSTDGGGAGAGFREIVDADIEISSSITASSLGLPTIMAHELGHTIGWRHSNADPASPNDSAHTCGGTDDCASATNVAIMYWQVTNAGPGSTLQPWDVNAVRAVYPTAACSLPSISAHPASTSITSGGSTTLSVTATGATSYQWYIGASGVTTTPVVGATSSSVLVTPASTTTYWVRVTNACGDLNSNAATVTVNAPVCTYTVGAATTTTYNARGGNGSINVTVSASGCTAWSASESSPFLTINAMGMDANGNGSVSYVVSPNLIVWGRSAVITVAGQPITITQHPVVRGDFNNDRQAELIWRNTSTGENRLWVMNQNVRTSTIALSTVADQNWSIRGSGDFNSDGHQDIVWRNGSTGENVVWFMNNTALSTSGSLATVLPSSGWDLQSVIDWNLDGKSDVVWRNVDGRNAVWIMNGLASSTVFNLPVVADATWKLVGTGLFDGDWQVDLLWRNSLTGEVVLWFMGGTTGTTIRESTAYPTVVDPMWKPGAIASYNYDGTPDIVWRNHLTGQNAFWATGGGLPGYTDYFEYEVNVNWAIVGPK